MFKQLFYIIKHIKKIEKDCVKYTKLLKNRGKSRGVRAQKHSCQKIETRASPGTRQSGQCAMLGSKTATAWYESKDT